MRTRKWPYFLCVEQRPENDIQVIEKKPSIDPKTLGWLRCERDESVLSVPFIYNGKQQEAVLDVRCPDGVDNPRSYSNRLEMYISVVPEKKKGSVHIMWIDAPCHALSLIFKDIEERIVNVCDWLDPATMADFLELILKKYEPVSQNISAKRHFSDVPGEFFSAIDWQPYKCSPECFNEEVMEQMITVARALAPVYKEKQ